MTRNAAPRAHATRDLAHAYAKALEDYVAGAGEQALRAAYDIGREAIADGRSLLDVAAMHQAALPRVLERRGAASTEQDLGRASEIFCECLSPYEMALRGFRESVEALGHLNDTLEHEIQRIARTVHDEAGQLLVAARLAMSSVAKDAGPPLESRMQELGLILQHAENELRRVSHELRPAILDDLGLVPALEFLADTVAKSSGVSVRVVSSLRGRAPPDVATALYRIVQEALTNVVRHSGARSATIRLTPAEDGLECLVADDGSGFDVRGSLQGHRGLGLTGIRERLNALGGTLRIGSEPGRGTELLAWIPMEVLP